MIARRLGWCGEGLRNLTKAPYKLVAKFLMEIQFFMFYTTLSNLGE